MSHLISCEMGRDPQFHQIMFMPPALCRAIKRIFDYVATGIAVVILAPLLLLIMLLAFLVQGRPIFYASERYIAMNRAVSIFKFRSMVKDATDSKYRLKERFLKEGYLDVPIDCEVYTPLGRVLERTQIVELPQLLNVVLNGMSIVGNRALPEENVCMLKEFQGWEERFESPCGLTGISQIVGKFNLTPEQRITLERLYSKVYKCGHILKCDISIVWATVRLILFDENLSYDDALALLNRCL